MHRGESEDGSDSFAEPLLAADDWPLKVVIAMTELAEKDVSSTSGMTRSTASPYYRAWIAGSSADLARARAAVHAQDFDALAAVAEHSCLKMHALALASEPPLVYWRGATLECIRALTELRAAGKAVFFTVDAGPQVKAVCNQEALEGVQAALSQIAGVQRVVTTGLGPGVQVG